MTIKNFTRSLVASAFESCDKTTSILTMTLLAATLTLMPQHAHAAKPGSNVRGATIIISNDQGGSVRKRMAEIQRIQSLGQSVEIRGGNCMSSCTMFIGLNSVCVSPRTVFGFHGPYRMFSKLSTAQFDAWSRVISSHYPEPIRAWYMEKARNNVATPIRLRGSELIRIGVRQCPN